MINISMKVCTLSIEIFKCDVTHCNCIAGLQVTYLKFLWSAKSGTKLFFKKFCVFLSVFLILKWLFQYYKLLNTTSVIGRSDDVIQPFILGCETKHPKLIQISITCIQKLISHDAVPDTCVTVIIRTLCKQCSILNNNLNLTSLIVKLWHHSEHDLSNENTFKL